MMKRMTILMAATLALSITPVYAATPQQQKMKTCTAEATKQNLKGDDRKTFMRECLSGTSTGTALPPQQEKMNSCNADATRQGIKGAARQKFMSDCLAQFPAPAAEPTVPAPVQGNPAPVVPTPVPTPQTAPMSPGR